MLIVSEGAVGGKPELLNVPLESPIIRDQLPRHFETGFRSTSRINGARDCVYFRSNGFLLPHEDDPGSLDHEVDSTNPRDWQTVVMASRDEVG